LIFAPTTATDLNGTLTISSNDINRPEYEIDILGAALSLPEIITPNSLNYTIASGTKGSIDFNIGNNGEGNLQWTSTIPLNHDIELEDTLSVLNARSHEITELIPQRYNFTEGESSFDISNGGNDMFDDGNRIKTNLDTFINYSNNVIQSEGREFGENEAFYTRKYEGLFVLAADIEEVDTFEIDGGIGGGQSGQVDTHEFIYDISNTTYRIYAKKVYGKATPSVNHLIIVEESPDLLRVASPSVTDDEHEVTGLKANSRLYYLMFGTTNGSEVTNLEFENIATKFLKIVALENEQVSIAPKSGIVPAADNNNINLMIDAFQLNAGIYNYDIIIDSNDLNASETRIPFELTVIGDPEISVSTDNLSLPTAVVGLSSSSQITISNTGSAVMTVNNIDEADQFTVDTSTPFFLLPGQSRDLTITYSPLTALIHTSVLTISSNATNVNNVSLTVTGRGILPPSASTSVSNIDIELGANASNKSSFDINNDGSSILEWNAFVDYGVNANTGTPQYSGLKILAVNTSLNEYATLKSSIESNGGIFTEITASDFEISELENYDILFIQDLSPLFNYLTTINLWVENGGSLLFVDDSFFSTNVNTLLSGSGITREGSLSDFHNFETFPYHQVTQNIDLISGSIRFSYTAEDNVTPLVTATDGSIFSALSSIGQGKVITIADNFSSLSSGSSNIRYLENCLLWLGNRTRGWIDLIHDSGTILPNDLSTVVYSIVSDDLTLGRYNADIIINTNDPENLEYRIPVSITVTDAAEISTPDDVYFNITNAGLTTANTLIIENAGHSPLIIHSLDLTGDYSSNLSLPLTINPRSSHSSQVFFHPQSPGEHEATLTIESNALTNASQVIRLHGYAEPSPVFTATSNSINSVIPTNSSTVQEYTISNTGDGTLDWSLMEINGTSNDRTVSYPPDLTNTRLGLIINSPSTFSSYQDTLLAFGANIIHLSPFLTDSILETVDTIIYDEGVNLSQDAITKLHTWVENGGSFIVSSDSESILNNIIEPFDMTANQYSGDSFSVVTPVGSHPIFNGVSEVQVSFPKSHITIPDAATTLLQYSDGSTAAAYLAYGNGELIVCSFDALDQVADAETNEIFFTNCISFISQRIPWFTSSRESGSISAGESETLFFTFDSRDLTQGNYLAQLVFSTNDRANLVHSVPLTLTVKGLPGEPETCAT